MVTYGASFRYLDIHTCMDSAYSKYPTQPTMVETPHTLLHDIELEYTQLTWGVQPSCWVLESGYGVQHAPVWLIVGDDLRNTTGILSDGSLKVFGDNTIFIHSNWRRRQQTESCDLIHSCTVHTTIKYKQTYNKQTNNRMEV